MAAFSEALATLAQAGPFAPERIGERDWFVDAVTLRIAATRYGLWFTCDDKTAFDGHRDTRPPGRLTALADAAPLPVALVVLARQDGAQLQQFLKTNMAGFAETVVVLDSRACQKVAGAGVTTVCRALDGDFASQRNAGNEAASAGWVFHLDLDESISSDLPVALGHMARCAQQAGLRAVGLPRQNRVDGVLSDLFPDTQYRLMARDERFENRVHERPVACRDWTSTTIFQHAPLLHHLSRERVVQRSRDYDALGQSADRHGDMESLLRVYHG